MASIYQPAYTQRLPDGSMVKRRSRTWWIEISSKGVRVLRKPGFRDKKATEILAADLERKLLRGAVDAVDPFEEMRRLPLEDHYTAYETHLKSKGVTAKHLRNTLDRLKAAMKHAKAVRISDLLPQDIENFLLDRKEKGTGGRTRNLYLSSIRAFYRWAVRTKRTPEDPTTTIASANEREDLRRERRAETLENLVKFLEAARTRPLAEMREYRTHKPLTLGEVRRYERLGIERALIYKTAILTGLRRGELSRLTWDDLALEGPRPTLRVCAASAKNRREAVLPMRVDLAEDLRAWRKSRPEAPGSDRVFQVPGEHRPAHEARPGAGRDSVRGRPGARVRLPRPAPLHGDLSVQGGRRPPDRAKPHAPFGHRTDDADLHGPPTARQGGGARGPAGPPADRLRSALDPGGGASGNGDRGAGFG